jgi:hypothetical protein
MTHQLENKLNNLIKQLNLLTKKQTPFIIIFNLKNLLNHLQLHNLILMINGHTHKID